MVQSSQLSPGMTIAIGKKLFRVESMIKVSVPKGASFIKTTLRDMALNKVEEKNFKPTQQLEEVELEERRLEFLYIEGKNHLFLDIDRLEQLLVPSQVVGDRGDYLTEGTEVKGSIFNDKVYSIELPQFLEIMVSHTEDNAVNGGNKQAVLETGASIEVPQFVEIGDVIKVDTMTKEYIQRV